MLSCESRLSDSITATILFSKTWSPASISTEEMVPPTFAVMLTESIGEKVPTSLQAMPLIIAVALSPEESAPGFAA